MTRLAGVMYICDVCGKEFFCEEDSTSGYFIDNEKYGKIYYKKPPAGWTPEMCPECNDRITRAIREEQSKIRRERNGSELDIQIDEPNSVGVEDHVHD